MKDFRVQVGGFYVNEREGIVRELTDREDRDKISFRSYHLRTGTPHQILRNCLEAAIFDWADREASPDEVARTKVSDANMREEQEVAKIMVTALKNVPDELILAEVKRRGLKPE